MSKTGFIKSLARKKVTKRSRAANLASACKAAQQKQKNVAQGKLAGIKPGYIFIAVTFAAGIGHLPKVLCDSFGSFSSKENERKKSGLFCPRFVITWHTPVEHSRKQTETLNLIEVNEKLQCNHPKGK